MSPNYTYGSPGKSFYLEENRISNVNHYTDLEIQIDDPSLQEPIQYAQNELRKQIIMERDFRAYNKLTNQEAEFAKNKITIGGFHLELGNLICRNYFALAIFSLFRFRLTKKGQLIVTKNVKLKRDEVHTPSQPTSPHSEIGSSPLSMSAITKSQLVEKIGE